jgi:hypothetical protein
MSDLGSLGVVHQPVIDADPHTFDWFGTRIRVQVEVNQVELIDLMDAARSVDFDSAAALATVKDAFRAVLYPEDFPVFWAAAREQRQTAEDLAGVLQVLFEGVMALPTPRQSGSSPGLSSTALSLLADSSSAGSPGTPPRPDLQLIRDDYEATRQRLLTG